MNPLAVPLEYTPCRPEFSLILATLGRVEEVRRLLKSLQRQSYKNFELIIVDQNCDGRLDGIITEASQYLNMTWLWCNPGLSRARNIGLLAASGRFIAFPDDDCWYPQDLLQLVYDAFGKDPGLDVITGRSIASSGASTHGHWPLHPQPLTRRNVWHCAISYSMFITHRFAKKVGDFDEELGVGSGTRWGSGEETDYLLRGLQQQLSGRYIPTITVFHEPATNYFSPSNRQKVLSYARGCGYVLRKQGATIQDISRHLGKPLLGSALYLFKGNLTMTRYYWDVFIARLEGWLNVSQQAGHNARR